MVISYPTRSQEGSHFAQSHARTNVLYHSFFPSTIALWNSLPPSVTLSSSVSAFKQFIIFWHFVVSFVSQELHCY